MKKILMNFALVLTLSLISAFTFGQHSVKGVVVDENTGESLIGATVVVEGVAGGTATDIDGSFSLEVPAGEQTLTISFIGYLSKTISLTDLSSDLGQIKMAENSIGIAEVGIIASVAIDRKTPVAVSSIKPEIISEKLGTQEFPEILKSTPSIYVTRAGGGYGDSRINLRGFDSRNIAVMINGVPVNDMESGKVYWSNWAGLADATRSMQVQRGLGASKVAVPSVGGTINILTKTTDAQKGGNVSFGVGNDGYEKWGLSLASGLTENNWAFAFSLAHSYGDGYVDGTAFDAWSYYASVAKEVNENHRLSFSIFGAPQTHNQRYSRLKVEDYERINKGITYNPDWGYQNGQIKSASRNFYHKPQAILNHFWTISDKTSLVSAVYASVGTGGGIQSAGDDKYDLKDILVDDQIDFDQIVANNQALGSAGSSAILKASINNHQWAGIITTLNHQLNDNLTLIAGLDYRYYRGEHYSEVNDLLGGAYYNDDSDISNPINLAKVGDKIEYHNDGLVGWLGGFAQVEYTLDKLSAFAAGAISNMSMTRKDYFQYTGDEQTSDKYTKMGFSGKGGANYNLTDNHNVFVNAGYFERQPSFKTVFNGYVNTINEGAENEKIQSYELGYGYRSSKLKLNFNGYYTVWGDKTLTRSVEDISGEYFTANMTGVDAVHMGLELDFVYTPVKKLSVTGMVSVGDWRWKNDLENVGIFDDGQNKVDEISVYIKDVKVGDAAQTTAAVGINYIVMKGLKVGLDYNHYANLFAYFDPTQRGSAPEAGESNYNSWEVPAYRLLDVNLKYDFEIGNLKSTFYSKVNNLLDTEYIADGTDGADHDWQSSTMYYGAGRTWSFGLKVRF